MARKLRQCLLLIAAAMLATGYVLEVCEAKPIEAPTQTAVIPPMGRGEDITITGTSEPGARITIIYKDTKTGVILRVDNKVATVDTTGIYSHTILEIPHANTTRPDPLAGKVDIVLVAVDVVGNLSPENHIGTMLVDRVAPTIAVAGPPDGFTTSDAMVRVYGMVIDTYSGVTSAIVGGQVVQLAPDGEFSATVWLAEGANTITVSAADAVGNTVSKTITINRTAAPQNLLFYAGAGVAGLIAAAVAVKLLMRS